MRLPDISTRLTPIFAILILGLLGVGCDSSGLTGAGGPGNANNAAGGASAKGGPGGAGGSGAASGQGSGNVADVRVAHLSPDAPGVDVYVGLEPGDGDPTIPGLTYPNFAPNADGDYVQLDPGTYDVAVTPAGGTAQAIDVDGLSLAPNKDYTILAIGELNPEGDEPGIQALPLVDNGEDDPALPPRDKTLVRFVHASPDAGTVDIAVKGGPTLLSGVEFGDASGYIEVAPGDYTIDVGPGALEVPFTAVAGTKVTAYVIGNASPEEGDAELSAVTSLEATSPAGTGPLGDDGDEGNDEEDDDEEEDDEDDEDEEVEEDEDDEDDED